jgi:hypothetical protein
MAQPTWVSQGRLRQGTEADCEWVDHQKRTDELRRRLDHACVLAGIPPVPPAVAVLPQILLATPSGIPAADLFTFSA